MPFAIIFGGAPLELQPGEPFQTDRSVVSSNSEAAATGQAVGSILLGQIVDHPASDLDDYSPMERMRFLIQAFTVPAAPAGQVMVSYALSVVEGSIVAVATFTTAPVPVPVMVSMMQAQLALEAAGLLDAVLAAVAAADAITKIYWNTASDLHREHPLVLTLGAALGLTAGQIDDLFRAAVLIT